MAGRKVVILMMLAVIAGGYFSSLAAEEKIIVAVLDLEVGEGVSQKVAKILSDSLRTQLVNTRKFIIVSRESVESILKEQNLQLSGVTEKVIAEAGQLIGAQKVFVGSVGKVGSNYLLNLKSVDVKSGKIEQAEKEECSSEEQFSAAVSNLANKMAGLSTKLLEKVEVSTVPAYDLKMKGSAFGAKFISKWGDGNFGVISCLALKTFIDSRKGLEIGFGFVPGGVALGDFDVVFHKPAKVSPYYGYGGNFLYTFGNNSSVYNLLLPGSTIGFGFHAKGGLEVFLGKVGISIEGTTGYMYGYDNNAGTGNGYFFYSVTAGARLYFSAFSIF